MSSLVLSKRHSASSVADWFHGLQTRFTQYRMYRKTLKELSVLGNRELEDLGLNRSMLKRVAYQAAYRTH